MNFDYSDDQKFLKDEARKFLDARCPPATTRAVLNDPAKSYDAALWRSVAETGWTGAVVPEAYGGTGLGHVELCALAEELGRVVAPIPFASTVYIFAEAVLKFGSEAQKATLLPGVAGGDVIGCLATTEAPGPLAPDKVTATVGGDRLTGIKHPVTDGDIATHAIVLAMTAEGPGLFIVDLAAPGVMRETVATLDPTRGVARLGLEGAPCERLGALGEGAQMLSSILDRAAVLFAFEQVGGADRCLEMARAYALDRYAFGRVIASYQERVLGLPGDIRVDRNVAFKDLPTGA